MSGPTDDQPAVRPLVAWACLVLVVVTIAMTSGLVRLPATLFSSRVDEVIDSAALTAFWAGLLLNGLWTGDMLIMMIIVTSKGRSWATRKDDPWMFWSLAVFYSFGALVGSYFLVRAVLR